MTTAVAYNLTDWVITSSVEEITKSWVENDNSDFLWSEILSRGAFLILAPTAVIICALDTILGFGAALASFASLGMHEPTVDFATNHLDSFQGIIAQPFSLLVQMVNPHADFNNTETFTLGGRTYTEPKIKSITNLISNRLFFFSQQELQKSEYFLVRHVFSRATYALEIPLCIITKVADTAIGCIALPFDLITLGTINELNIYGRRAFTIPGIINQFFLCAIKTINPWSIKTSLT